MIEHIPVGNVHVHRYILLLIGKHKKHRNSCSG